MCIRDRDETIPPALQTELYLIAQEALNNSLKHAAASAITVTVRAAPDSIWLEVRDNGRGFDLDNGQANGIGSVSYTHLD